MPKFRLRFYLFFLVHLFLIPSPNVAEDHQTKNAKYLYDLEAAELIHEDEIHYKLKNIINKIFISDKYRNQLANNLKSLSTINLWRS